MNAKELRKAQEILSDLSGHVIWTIHDKTFVAALDAALAIALPILERSEDLKLRLAFALTPYLADVERNEAAVESILAALTSFTDE